MRFLLEVELSAANNQKNSSFWVPGIKISPAQLAGSGKFMLGRRFTAYLLLLGPSCDKLPC